MADVRYIFGNLKTGEVINEIPLYGVAPMTRKLNDWGNFNGTCNLDRSGMSNLDVKTATIPGQCYVICERGNNVVWGGIVWTRSYQSQSKSLQISARTFEAYPESRKIGAFTRTNIEQRTIFVDLWTELKNNFGDLGLTIPTGFSTLVPKTVEVLATDRKNYLQVMSGLSDGEDGFDWTIDVTKTPSGVYSKTLRLGYPVTGATDPTGLQLEYPGSITNYYATESMSEAGTHVTILGIGEGSSMLTGTYIHQDLINSGQWLRWDLDVSRKQIGTSQLIVNSLAGTIGPQRRPPLTIHKVFLKADRDPIIGSFGLGDACTLVIEDPLYSVALQASARIVAIAYKPAQSGESEEAELIFQGDDLNG